MVHFFFWANAACVSNVDDFVYLPVFRAQKGGGKFDVRVGANADQFISKNFEWTPTFESVAHRSVALAARLSDCTVSWVIGDPSVQVLGLSCDGAPPAKKPKLWSKFSLSCDRYEYRHGPDELICDIQPSGFSINTETPFSV